MNLKELFTEDRGVSPVIGVILMVAITVILAAVIGAFVLGLGDQASSSAPQASFSFAYETDTDNSTMTITHGGGENVDSETLSVTLAGTTIYENNDVAGDDDNEIELPDDNNLEITEESAWEDTIRTSGNLGITLTEAEGADDISEIDGEDVRLIWTDPGGGSSNTIAQSRWSI